MLSFVVLPHETYHLQVLHVRRRDGTRDVDAPAIHKSWRMSGAVMAVVECRRFPDRHLRRQPHAPADAVHNTLLQTSTLLYTIHPQMAIHKLQYTIYSTHYLTTTTTNYIHLV